jgi:chromate transporter
MSTATPPGTHGAPASLRELFLAFNRLALQGFGGVLPVAQRELVERRRWLTKDEFVEMLAVSQVLPGPNVVNLALMFGDRSFGTRGALAALAGMLLAPLVVVLALTVLYVQFDRYPMVTGALRGMGAVAAGLILSTGLKLLVTLRRNVMGLPIGLGLAALTVLGTAWLRLPLVWVVLGLGAIAIAIAWKRLRP